ncbi:MAG TPA: type II toxin-antitoxin system prevent-host-death family antitoxin [Actinomycetota bacterium]|nr:type II toxin-antitoxin system prevent-host-death family antitoxin [Actinomycetota bacterium]
MERIGVRELRQHASLWLRRVGAGESFEITDRGRPVALLIPTQKSEQGLEALIASGRARPAAGPLPELGHPLHSVQGEPSLSEILADMRADER